MQIFLSSFFFLFIFVTIVALVVWRRKPFYQELKLADNIQAEEMINDNLGIIAGNGSLPKKILQAQSILGRKCYLVLIKDEADPALYENYPYIILSATKIQKAIHYFKEVSVKEIVFAGGVKRPSLSDLGKLDSLARKLLAKILKNKFLGDDKLLRVIKSFFQEQGFEIKAASELLGEGYCLQKEYLPYEDINESDYKDVELGLKIARQIGEMDIGQAVIVEDGLVIGVEAVEGTDELIHRSAKLRKKNFGGILVKTMKPSQDNTLDIPTIGLNTVKNLAKYNFRGIVLEKEKVIVLDPEAVQLECEKAKMFLIFRE